MNLTRLHRRYFPGHPKSPSFGQNLNCAEECQGSEHVSLMMHISANIGKRCGTYPPVRSAVRPRLERDRPLCSVQEQPYLAHGPGSRHSLRLVS